MAQFDTSTICVVIKSRYQWPVHITYAPVNMRGPGRNMEGMDIIVNAHQKCMSSICEMRQNQLIERSRGERDLLGDCEPSDISPSSSGSLRACAKNSLASLSEMFCIWYILPDQQRRWSVKEVEIT